MNAKRLNLHINMTQAVGKLILTILLCLGISTIADAQLRYGFRFGGDFAKATLGGDFMKAIENVTLKNGSGFSGGLALEYQCEKCGFAPDIALLYTRYNTRLRLPDSDPRSFGRNFIEVPIHLKWKFWIPQAKNLVAPMVYTGPSLMFRAGHNAGIPLPAASESFATKAFQPGWDVGIGFDAINFIQLTAGYRFGLANAASTPTDATLHTNAWTLSATILFDF